MNDAERFLLINRQCENVSRLIDEAERTPDRASAEALYRLAIDRTSIISEAVRRELRTMIRETPDGLENAA
ncbi:MAG: hypothetical protein FVQ81_17385 [Candidatus Glassbacteria bacterium]|nr:hypothetical protein [Candidatus Glassbacteria bacterium]